MDIINSFPFTVLLIGICSAVLALMIVLIVRIIKNKVVPPQGQGAMKLTDINEVHTNKEQSQTETMLIQTNKPNVGNKDLVEKFYGLTHCGRIREHNEDTFLIYTCKISRSDLTYYIFGVADGMGGMEKGEVASSLALETINKEFANIDTLNNYDEWLSAVVNKANSKLVEYAAQKSYTGLGSTLVVALLIGKKIFINNVGDSRCYLLRDNKLEQITRDHSLVSIMVEKNILRPEEVYTHPRRNELINFLGTKDNFKSDGFKLTLQKGDRILLCSDGLWGMVKDAEIQRIIVSERSPEICCQRLIDAANQSGGTDNITVVMIYT